MPIPTVRNIELPLLKVIQDTGGELQVKQAVEKVTSYFPDLTQEERARKLPSGTYYWVKQIEWASTKLKMGGYLDKPIRGFWRINDEGRARVKREFKDWQPRYGGSKPRKESVTTAGEKQRPDKPVLEKNLYDPIKKALEQFLGQENKLYLEDTHKNSISKKLKDLFDNAAFLFLMSQKVSPDLMGYVEEAKSRFGLGIDEGSTTEKIIVEVKNEEIKILDLYQAKRYAEVFGAKYAFLISIEDVPGELKRFIKGRPEVVKYQYSGGTREIIFSRYDESSRKLSFEDPPR